MIRFIAQVYLLLFTIIGQAQIKPELIPYLYYTNENEKIGDIYFIDKERAIAIQKGTTLVLLKRGLIEYKLNVKGLVNSNWEAIQQVIPLGSDKFMVLTRQSCFNVWVLNDKFVIEDRRLSAGINKTEIIRNAFNVPIENIEDVVYKYCLMGKIGSYTFGYYLPKKNQLNKKMPQPPRYWVQSNGKVFNINSEDAVVTKDRFNDDWYAWMNRYDCMYTFHDSKLYLISPEANKMYEFDTLSNKHRSIMFNPLHNTKSWYYYYDYFGKQSYWINKISEKEYAIYTAAAADEKLKVATITFFPTAIVNGKVHWQKEIKGTRYYEHYLIPLTGEDEQKVIILDEAKILIKKN